MSISLSLILVLAIYVGASLVVHRRTLRDYWFTHHELRDETAAASTFTWGILSVLVLLALGGVMVLAGAALVFESGNLNPPMPVTSSEMLGLLRDVIPGLLSIIVGFLLLEASNRTQRGAGPRHG